MPLSYSMEQTQGANFWLHSTYSGGRLQTNLVHPPDAALGGPAEPGEPHAFMLEKPAFALQAAAISG